MKLSRTKAYSWPAFCGTRHERAWLTAHRALGGVRYCCAACYSALMLLSSSAASRDTNPHAAWAMSDWLALPTSNAHPAASSVYVTTSCLAYGGLIWRYVLCLDPVLSYHHAQHSRVSNALLKGSDTELSYDTHLQQIPTRHMKPDWDKRLFSFIALTRHNVLADDDTVIKYR